IEMSKNDPAQQAELMAKTFNLPVNNYLAYFSNEECKGWLDKFDKSLFVGNEERSARCVLGVDLSDVNDICSVSFMVVRGEERQYLNKKFMPRHTIEGLPKELRDKYAEWELSGQLHVHELDYNDQAYIFEELRQFMSENRILPVAVGYDRWNAKELIRLINDYYGDICHDIPQTVKSLSNP
ncbi:terminase TerL endonuclease subunit, partial [Streptococcus pneumoniae]